jgi:hypothetical protein
MILKGQNPKTLKLNTYIVGQIPYCIINTCSCSCRYSQNCLGNEGGAIECTN